MLSRQIVYRNHALRRMVERGIDPQQVLAAVESGETIQAYPQDRPYPSRLILHVGPDGPIHVVAADDPNSSLTVIITVYEPDPSQWSEDFRHRII